MNFCAFEVLKLNHQLILKLQQKHSIFYITTFIIFIFLEVRDFEPTPVYFTP